MLKCLYTCGMAKQKVAVSERAIFQRINRKLHQDGEMLKTSRSERVEQQVGRYYVVDIRRNFIARRDVDLIALGRELGVLKPWEAVEP